MKSKIVLCPACGARMWRKYGYKKAWYNAKHAYKTVYDCPECGNRLKNLAMDEDAFMNDRKNLLEVNNMHECPICGQICDCACDCEEQAERWDGMEDFANEKLEEFGCLYGAACCMPGLHFPSECHTAKKS